MGFPRGSDGKKKFTCNVGDLCSIPGLGRSPGGGHGSPLQYSCLGNPMGGGVWQAPVLGATKSRTQLKRLSTHAYCSCRVATHFITIYKKEAILFCLIKSSHWWLEVIAQVERKVKEGIGRVRSLAFSPMGAPLLSAFFSVQTRTTGIIILQRQESLQGDPTSPFWRSSVLGVLWKDWC